MHLYMSNVDLCHLYSLLYLITTKISHHRSVENYVFILYERKTFFVYLPAEIIFRNRYFSILQ